MTVVMSMTGKPVILIDRCACCTKRINSEQEGFFNKLCELCYESAGVENEHTDTEGLHNGRGITEDCPTCWNLDCMHRKEQQ